jgi:hypothetical protein
LQILRLLVTIEILGWTTTNLKNRQKPINMKKTNYKAHLDMIDVVEIKLKKEAVKIEVAKKCIKVDRT